MTLKERWIVFRHCTLPMLPKKLWMKWWYRKWMKLSPEDRAKAIADYKSSKLTEMK